jgi:hypothetical protein
VRCPLCGVRKARRACPAQSEHICSVCCGTKRQVEIACPPDCGYLTSAREHPPAIERRRHEQDLARIAPLVRDFTDLQAELFLLLTSATLRDAPGELQKLLDEDVAGAAAALAATLETASRGVLYEHRPPTRPAERLMGAFRALLHEAGKTIPESRVERDAILVLRRLEQGARSARESARASRDFIELLSRVVRLPEEPARAAVEPAPRLIVP